MKDTFKDRLKKVDKCVWWLLGIMCFLCVLLILGGSILCFTGETLKGIILLLIGIIAILFFGGFAFVLPYIEWKKGIKAKVFVSPPKHNMGQISKQSVFQDLYNEELQRKKFLPICVAVAVIVFLIYSRYNDLTDFTRLIILIAIECAIIFAGVFSFVSASKSIKEFHNVELEFHKRPVFQKTFNLGVDGGQDTYEFSFEGFKRKHIMVADANYSRDIDIGDDCILVCYKNKKTFIKVYCMKHWDIAEDILDELK